MNAANISVAWKDPLANERTDFNQMGQVSDAELLRSYLGESNEESFTLLLQRHWPLVYGVAHRRTGNAPLAQDIAQAVFIIFERKCAGFSKGTVLAGWFFRTTMFTANNALKAEARRSRREEQAVSELAGDETTPAQAWEVISKDLDEGLADLPPTDRDALILRFLQDQSFKQVGAALGVNEHSARQRASRALEKLRRFLKKRGIIYPLPLLTLALDVRPTHCAPPAELSSSAARTLAGQTLSLMKWRQAKTVFALSLVLATLSGLIVMESFRTERKAVIARRRAIEAVDQTLWRGDGGGFSRSISFGIAPPDQARSVLAAYAISFHRLQQSFAMRFDAASPNPIGTMTALEWLVGNKIKEQTVVNQRDHAVNQIVPGHSMRLIRDRGAWKWDLFEHSTAAEANALIEQIRHQTAVFEALGARIDQGDFERAEEASQALRQEVAKGALLNTPQ